MKRISYILIFFLSSCSLQDMQEESSSPVVDGRKVKTEVISQLASFGIHEPGGLLKSGAECIISDRLNTDNIYRVDLQTRQKEGLFPRVRTRSGRAVVLNSLASDGQGGWTALNFRTGELNRVGSAQTRSGENAQFTLPAGQRHLWAVQAGEYVLATGLYSEGRYMLYSPSSGEACYFVNYPEHPGYPDLKEYTKAALYASNVLRVRPDGGAFICADMYSGVVDICRIDEGEITLVRRLVYHYPDVKIRGNKSCPSVVYSRDNRFGFTDVSVTSRRIYALYSGRSYRMGSHNFQYCRNLIEIDWEGNVRSTYPVDTDLTQIAYDEQEKALYGIGWGPKATLVRLDINPE